MSTVQPLCTATKNFSTTDTCRALRAACLGEMHAQRLYQHAAERMEKNRLYVIAHAFLFTAAQEKEHADVFRGLMAACGARDLPLAEDAPLLLPREPLDILKAVVQSEHSEWDQLYPHHADLADKEGYPRVAAAFRRIAETEQVHAMRFLQYAKALAEGSLFRARRRISWLCLACGQLTAEQEAPRACPSCGKDRGHFIRSNFHPFTVSGAGQTGQMLV